MRACECASECVCIKWLFGLSLIYWAFIYVHRLQIMAKCVYLSERESLIIFYVHTHTHIASEEFLNDYQHFGNSKCYDHFTPL